MADQNRTVSAAYVAVSALFFAWGFITSLIDPLVAAVKGIFTLTNLQAQLSAFAFFIAYGLVSFPAAALIARIKAVPAILVALTMMAIACLIMLGAVNLAVYGLVLVGLFVLASGVTVLQVAANPLAASLGPPEASHFRLMLSQTFNSLGTFAGPLVGASLFLDGVEAKEGTVITSAGRAAALAGIDRAYFWICGLLLALLLFFWWTRRSVAAAAPASAPFGGFRSLIAEAFASRWALLGGSAIFLYVGAEVAIGTQMALFLNSDQVWGRSDAPFAVPLLGWVMGSDGVPGVGLQEAGKAVAFYWGGAMVGRIIGSALLARFRAARLLTLFTATAAAMCLYLAFVGGVSAGFVALAIGLANSIMFPVIFTLTLERSSASAEATSGLLCTAIIGGAFVPLLVGVVSDSAGYLLALIVPAVCYVLLCAFGFSASRVRPLQLAKGQATH
jgi:FHS family L-fucose permease-like MFS transporter